jgi:hypothetical protein
MKVEKTIELPDGSLTFQGELTAQELDTVIMYGLNTLLALGALKPTVVEVDDEDQLDLFDLEGDDTLQ